MPRNPYGPQRAKSPAERTHAFVARVAALPDVVAALDASGVNVDAWHDATERAAVVRGSSHRTEYLPSTDRTECGTVAVHRTFGRGTDADAYPLLDGAPVGSPDSLVASRKLAADIAAEDRAAAFIANRNERAGLTPRQRKRLRSSKPSAADVIIARLAAVRT